MKVLVAEDDPGYRRMLEVTFSRWGYDVVACSNGLQAWDRLKEEDPPKLAVLDWMMPGLDGPDLCRRIRASPDLSSIYVILLTARDTRDDMIEGLDAGADDLVSKPFDGTMLAARVRVGERLAGLLGQAAP